MKRTVEAAIKTIHYPGLKAVVDLQDRPTPYHSANKQLAHETKRMTPFERSPSEPSRQRGGYHPSGAHP